MDGILMPTTTAVRFAEIYERGTDMLIVVRVTGRTIQVREVVDGFVVQGRNAVLYKTRDELADWTLLRRLPTLACVDAGAARQAAKFLTGKGISNVFTSSNQVAVSMQPGSVMKFADDALANGWAHDADCARMIGELG
jgi:hypothetical protein